MYDIYQQNILDHYHHPRNMRALAEYDIKEEGDNPSCGDSLTLFLRFDPEGTITDVGYVADGCAISTAAMSLLSEKIKGMSRSDVSLLSEKDVYELLGVPIGPEREKCALLSLRTLQAGVKKSNVG